jgi:hypothetical protein
VKLAPGVSASVGRHAIESVLKSYPTATLLDQAQYITQQAKQIDQMLNHDSGLLALAVLIALIALIGITNTLALSPYDRTRALGLLRGRHDVRVVARDGAKGVAHHLAAGRSRGTVRRPALRLGDGARAESPGASRSSSCPWRNSCSSRGLPVWPGRHVARPRSTSRSHRHPASHQRRIAVTR